MPRKPSPQGTPRLRLSASFLESLAKDFEKHRDEVIEALRRESPKAYAELLGRLVQTADPPESDSFKNAKSMRDIGLRLLISVGAPKEEITDEQIDLAVIANNNFVDRLEEIAGTKGTKDLN
jgi:hypothetical protein